MMAAAVLALASALTVVAAAPEYSLFGGLLPDRAPVARPSLLLAHGRRHRGAAAAAAGRPPPEDAPWWAHAARVRAGALRFDEPSPANGRVTVREVGKYRVSGLREEGRSEGPAAATGLGLDPLSLSTPSPVPALWRRPHSVGRGSGRRRGRAAGRAGGG